jgi:phenylpyruvate tautomerase PptA (4-oxalocrotonate tautomerase family)
MPVLQVYYPEGSLPGERKAALARRLTDVLLTMEGGAKTRGGLAFATVLFTQVAAADWWVGGRTDATYVAPPGKFLVRVSVPEGYMNKTHKTEVHAAVNAAIVAIAGTPGDPHRGETISLAMIADTVGLAKTSERFKWVRAYFDAKARARAAANYPTDTGGLLPP